MELAAARRAASLDKRTQCVACQKIDGPFEHTDKDTGLPLCLKCVDQEEDPEIKGGALFENRAARIHRLALDPTSVQERTGLVREVPAELSEWLAEKVPTLKYKEAVGRQFSALVRQAGERAYDVISTQNLNYDAAQDAIDAYTKAFASMLAFVVDNWNMRSSLAPAQITSLESRASLLRTAEIKQMYRPTSRNEEDFRATARVFGDQLEWAIASSPEPTFAALVRDM